MNLFDETYIHARRKKAEAALGANSPIVLVVAGEPIGKPGGLDQTYPFVPHPLYYWLTGSRRWGGVLAWEPDHGWTHFVRPVTADERLWEGGGTAPAGTNVSQLPEWLSARSGRSLVVVGAPLTNLPTADDKERASEIAERLDAVRRAKDEAELALIQRAITATAAGFRRAREVIRPGVTEREVRIELEAEMWRQGADEVGFDTIVGAGSNAAILHFAPSQRVVGPQDVVLVDAGGAIAGYTADVTRTFAASGQFTAEQQAIYDVVLAGQQAAIERCRVGVEWHEVHYTAARTMAQGLIDLGILRGSLDEVLDNGTIALFFPHGIGHM